jgi:excisionase family DNA binding protein
MDELTSLSIEEVAELLKVKSDVVKAEIESGSLGAFMIGGEWRITRKNLIDFISRGGSKPIVAKPEYEGAQKTGIVKSAPFHFTWPNGKTEEYPEAYEGTANDGNMQFEVKIGVCERPAAGMNRKRITVFLNGRPTVEFVGTDDFEESKRVASLIVLPNKKRLRPNQTVPNEYRSFNLVRYNSVVKGPRAATTMAVLSQIDDIDTIVAHAIIRANYRDRK